MHQSMFSPRGGGLGIPWVFDSISSLLGGKSKVIGVFQDPKGGDV